VNLVFDRKVKSAEIETTLDRFKSDNLKTSFIKDIYEGQGLSENEKSVTIRLVLASASGTLTEDDISATQSQLISYIAKTLGGKLRA
jgi:phenylalanyl-tRNA synthetase beta chain